MCEGRAGGRGRAVQRRGGAREGGSWRGRGLPPQPTCRPAVPVAGAHWVHGGQRVGVTPPARLHRRPLLWGQMPCFWAPSGTGLNSCTHAANTHLFSPMHTPVHSMHSTHAYAIHLQPTHTFHTRTYAAHRPAHLHTQTCTLTPLRSADAHTCTHTLTHLYTFTATHIYTHYSSSLYTPKHAHTCTHTYLNTLAQLTPAHTHECPETERQGRDAPRRVPAASGFCSDPSSLGRCSGARATFTPWQQPRWALPILSCGEGGREGLPSFVPSRGPLRSGVQTGQAFPRIQAWLQFQNPHRSRPADKRSFCLYLFWGHA